MAKKMYYEENYEKRGQVIYNEKLTMIPYNNIFSRVRG